jgi:hypothetical protein
MEDHRRHSLRTLSGLGGMAATALAAGPAAAHAFGQRYDLPLPLGLYLTGAGAAVALSFLAMAVFVRAGPGSGPVGRTASLALPLDRLPGKNGVVTAIRLLAVAAFVLIVVAGFLGNQSPVRNIAPTVVWVIWWVGMAYVSALIGDVWALINPWKIVFSWADALFARGRAGATLSLGLRYPCRLGAWPAVALLFVFAWTELVSETGEVPARIASMIVGYSALTWAGMVLFGMDTWLKRGEVFTVVFGLFARFAPTDYRRANPADGKSEALILRPPSVGLLTEHPIPASMMVFVLLILSTVTFDGFIETPVWAGFLEWIVADPLIRPLLLKLRTITPNLLVVVQTVALAGFAATFVGVYLMFGRLMAWATGGAETFGRISGYFVLTLVPIAIAYHLAHYLSYLLLAGQLVIPLASDPFGFGWDLFGTANYRIDISVVNARSAWIVSVTAIVVGHVVAVFLSHVMALRVFDDRSTVLRSQLPILVLMVGYTITSLWILSQPIVASPAGG